VSDYTRGVFNHPTAVAQSWYVLALSRDLRVGQARTVPLAARKITLFRGEDGRARAFDARCPHLGADLGRGCVVGNGLRCGFHHWRFAEDGRCVEAPQAGRSQAARAFSYPVEEKYGAIWVFNGPRALFPVPHFPDRERKGPLRSARLRPVIVGAHPHLVASNGLDLQHVRSVHGFEFAAPPVVDEPDPYRVRLRFTFLLNKPDPFQRAARLLAGATVPAVFTTWGGNLASLEADAGPVPVLAIFANQPLAEGGCESRAFLLGGSRLALLIAKLIVRPILREDTAILEGLRFRPRLSDADYPLAAFIRQVGRLEAFDPEELAAVPDPARRREDSSPAAPPPSEAAS
jgi:nitrite reductase/ring-hydroxylating ferredoxin subunit